MTKATYSVAVRRPFRLDLTAIILRRRTQNTISEWDGNTYCRVLTFGDTPVRMSTTQGGTANNPRLLITLESHTALSFDQQVEAQLMAQKMLGVTIDLEPFSNHIAHYPMVWKMVGPYIGARPTRYPTLFESLITAIACQHNAISTGIDNLNRLTERYGLPFSDGIKVMHAFPRAEDLRDATEMSLVETGFTVQTARTIIDVAKDVRSGKINLEQLELATKDEAFAYLSKVNGMSRWAVENVLVRGLGVPDVFPMDSSRAPDIFRRVLDLNTKPNYREMQALTSDWHPFEGYIYFYMQLENLRTNGLI